MNPARLLEVWEQAATQSPVRRAVVLGGLARPDLEVATIAELPLGVRDAALLRLRRELFGDRCTCLTDCPVCRLELEFSLSVAELLTQGREAVAPIWLDAGSHRIHLRPPNSTDLQALVALGGADFQELLLQRCILAAEPALDLQVGLSESVVRRLADALEATDPLSVIWIELNCEGCGHAWHAQFDIAHLLWSELDRWAGEMLDGVARLASAFGWSERDILAMSPSRRQRYLELASG